MTYAPSTGWDRRTNRRPSSVDRQPGRMVALPGAPAAGGGCGDIVSTAVIATR